MAACSQTLALAPAPIEGDAMQYARMLAAVCAVVMLCGTSADVRAHSGGLDKHGCHTQRATGEYHCHRGQPPARATPRPPAPAPSSLQPFGANPPARGRAFANCTEARAAGAAPVRRGDPGYGPHLERDNDGVGCEPYRGR